MRSVPFPLNSAASGIANSRGRPFHGSILGQDLTRSAPSNGPLSKLMSEEIIPGNEGARELSRLLRQYGCGPIQFAGTSDALYERHLIFDNVVDPPMAHPRERFEAIARSVRDVLSQRWVHTERSYERENPKRVYYLSMEFLLGRSLANTAAGDGLWFAI